ncbi:MAG: hypothetical protein JST85_08065 [Acidobacteria bacterium]|nr:hypothetical protein [Acidobacteriota bacterium]
MNLNQASGKLSQSDQNTDGMALFSRVCDTRFRETKNVTAQPQRGGLQKPGASHRVIGQVSGKPQGGEINKQTYCALSGLLVLLASIPSALHWAMLFCPIGAMALN